MPSRIRPLFSRWLAAAPNALKSAALVTAITLALLLMVEGAASVIVVTRGHGEAVLMERSHTDFDPELGWVNTPSLRVDDLYGPGLYLETNSQRFRHIGDFARTVPAGKVRVVCTGDSFTLGYGVKNDDAWCELLARKDARFEAVNMGQGGYGVDQAYLWYRRDGLGLEHDVLVFAFVATDFDRMMCSKFYGYPKPVLAVRDGKPQIQRRSSWLGFVTRGLGQRLSGMRELRFLELWRSFRPSAAGPIPDERVMTPEQGRALALSILDDLDGLHRARKTSFLVVLLPILEDYRKSEADEWQHFLHDELSRRGVPFLDLVAAIRDEPESLVPMLFRGHYNELGNEWVADRIYDNMVRLPHVEERLGRVGPASPPVRTLVPAGVRQSLEPVSLDGAHVSANRMAELAPLALDGSVATRWHSGAAQNGSEEVTVDLGAVTPLRQVRLELGNVGYDYGRSLALDVAEEAGHWVEVLRVHGDQVKIDYLDSSAGEAQILTLQASRTARYLRIRQLSRAAENFWSIAEIRLFRDK